MENKSAYTPVKASLPKRIGAAIVDIILFLVLLTGILFIVSYITGFQTNNALLEAKYIETGVFIQNEIGEYVFCDTALEECNKAWEIFNNDPEACYYYDHAIELTTLILTISVFVTHLILELIIPLILKNGRTVGKFLFKISMVDKTGIRVKPMQVFIRFLFGKFLVTTMLPIYGVIFMAFNLTGGLLGFLMAVVILGIDLILALFSDNKAGLASTIASVYSVDGETTMIFDTIEELNAKKAEEQRQKDTKKKLY